MVSCADLWTKSRQPLSKVGDLLQGIKLMFHHSYVKSSVLLSQSVSKRVAHMSGL